MGKRTLWTGIILGATVGGLVSLLNNDARNYVKNSATASLENLTFYSKNPEIAFKDIKSRVTRIDDFVNESTDNALNAIEQVENTVLVVRKSEAIEESGDFI